MKTAALIALLVLVVVAAHRVGSESQQVPPARVATPLPPEREPTQLPPEREATQHVGFWQLIADTRDAAGDDTGRQSELLEERLSRLPPEQIVDFQQIREGLDRQAYSWDIWGAAYVIEDGCSDDCFRDFRAYLISLGPGPYEAALRDPDSLAPVVRDAEEGDWENADDVAPDAYESATGEDFPGDSSDLSGDPRGEPWDDEEQETLVQRYPALAARFR